MNPQAKAKGGKVRTVMHEFGQGKLRSSSGQKVTNPKQAIAIALSEQRRAKKMNDGGDVETKGYKAHYEREKAENIADREAMNPVNWAKRAYSGVKSLFTPGSRKDAELGPDKTEKKARGGIASNPRFDKTIGADRKMGADYLSADRKQQRFMSGTSTQAKVNRQDTRHGKIDMPFSQLNKYAGMREGGNVKKYAEGGHMERLGNEGEGQSFKDAFREARSEGVKTFTWRGKKYTTNVAGPKAKAPSASPAAEAGAKYAAAYRAQQSAPKDGEGRARLDAEVTRLRDEYTKAASKPRPSEAAESDGNINPFRKGGNVKNAQMEMRHAKAMKKAGLPKKMVREEMAEAKKYARGGGIESRGKTKGTVIRMASGGGVRGGGCEQRGKTKGRMV